MENEKINLAILLLFSLLLSIYLFLRTYVISLDGAFQYIPIAKDFASGLIKKAVDQGQQPLYPFLVAFVSRWVPDFELAGKLVSSLFGILIIFPVYLLGKEIFNKKIAFFSSLFLMIHPYIRRSSADVLKESTYLFFLATAFWFAWRAIQREKQSSFLFIPIFSLLAYLTRPDGVEILLVVFFYIVFAKKFSEPGKKWRVILLLLVLSVTLFFPYILYLRETTGEWTLSKFKGIQEIFTWGIMRGEVSILYKILYSLKTLNLRILSIYHPLFILLLFVGLWKKAFSHPKNGEGFILSLMILHYWILFFLILNSTDWTLPETVRSPLFSGRHVLPLVLFSIYWVGEGFLTIFQWVSKSMESHRSLLRVEGKGKSAIILVTLLVLVLAIILPKTLMPQRYERLTEKWAGLWIKNQSGKGTTIFTTLHRVAYYAEGIYEYVDLKKSTVNEVKASMIEKKALYLVIREQDVSDYSEEVKSIQKDFVEIIRFEQERMEKIIIFKIVQL